MQPWKVAPPGARLPLLIFAVALVAGAALFLGVHRARGSGPAAPPPYVAGPAAPAAHLHGAP